MLVASFFFCPVASWATKPAKPATIKPIPFSTAYATALANSMTAEGKEYDRDFGGYFQEQYGSLLGSCIKSQPAPDLRKFDILVRVSKTGLPLEVQVSPKTATASCLQSYMRADTFPAPPKDSHWVRVEVKITE